MPDFSTIFHERVPVGRTVWLIVGPFVPVRFLREKEHKV